MKHSNNMYSSCSEWRQEKDQIKNLHFRINARFDAVLLSNNNEK